jgi:DmsE family decaheme c-type cytochrome
VLSILKPGTAFRAGRLLGVVALLVVHLAISPASAQNETKGAKEVDVEALLLAKFKAGEYSSGGADTCLRCHNEPEVASALFQGVHGNLNSSHSALAKLQCETCHGPQGRHPLKDEPMIQFGAKANVAAALQNSVCLSCHLNEADSDWHLNQHDIEEVACADCHRIHVAQDPVRKPDGQVKLCGACHMTQLAAFNKRSRHPLAGIHAGSDMSCTTCHNPHGSLTQGALRQLTLNDNCYECHAETRGPVLWEHAPVTEDCSLCHNPHGSTNEALLTRRSPQLCQSCHSAELHSSRALDNASGAFVVGQSCLNCHSKVHGSNHPSGSLLTR